MEASGRSLNRVTDMSVEDEAAERSQRAEGGVYRVVATEATSLFVLFEIRFTSFIVESTWWSSYPQLKSSITKTSVSFGCELLASRSTSRRYY